MAEKKQRILLVDDQAIILELFEAVLGREGYDVKTALGPERAYRLIASLHDWQLDLLITDFVMPDDNGVHFASVLLELRSFPVIILTGNIGLARDEIVRIFGSKPDNITILGKPVSNQILAAEVNKILKGSFSPV